MYEKLPVTVLIMTQNEERNIRFAINSVSDRFDQIIVTDSFSKDKTKQICLQYKEVEFYENYFFSWSEQRNWILDNCTIKNDIVFFLDADEYIEYEFINELSNLLARRIDFSAIYLDVKYIFLGKWLRYSYGHPSIKRIFNKKDLRFSGEGAREYAIINGEEKTITMRTPFIHHDRKNFSHWIIKHIHNADREVSVFRNNKNELIDTDDYKSLSSRLKIKLFIRKYIWNRLPIVLRPLLYFLYRYLVQLGFMDGRAGFYYCFNHALWYQYLINIRLEEDR